MTRRAQKPVACLLALTALVGAGCNRGPAFAEVEGTVRVKGKPADNLMVVFVPDTEKGTTGPDSFGYTDENGHYTLTSHTNIRGAVVGNHRVVVRDLNLMIDEARYAELVRQNKLPKRRVPARYEKVDQTPLHSEVKSGQRQIIDLDVSGPP